MRPRKLREVGGLLWAVKLPGKKDGAPFQRTNSRRVSPAVKGLLDHETAKPAAPETKEAEEILSSRPVYGKGREQKIEIPN